MPRKEVRPYAPRPGSHLVLVIPDIHIPHHDRKALACALGVIEMMKPQRTVFLGDVLDAEAFSSHPRGSRAEDRAQTFFEGEVQPCRRMLTWIEQHTDEIIFLEGNHCHRVERTVVAMDGVMLDLADLVSPRRLLSEGRTKPFTYIPYVQKPMHPLPHYKIAADLIAVHGWSFCRHAAAKHLDIARRYSVVHGHTHRMQTFTGTDPLTRKTYKAWSPGCLARVQPLYMQHTPTDWVHGFSLVWVTNDLKRWTEYTVLIRDGTCVLPDGRKVDHKAHATTLRAIERGEAA